MKHDMALCKKAEKVNKECQINKDELSISKLSHLYRNNLQLIVLTTEYLTHSVSSARQIPNLSHWYLHH
jgi:hypothetical protein